MLLAREDRTTALLEAIRAGGVKPDELTAAQVQALTRHKVPQIASLAKTALASVLPPSRSEAVAKFRPAAEVPGDAARGKAHYQGRCMICHRADGLGVELGPDLVTVKASGREALLRAILEPHQEVAPQYIAYEVTTKDGNAYTGMIASDAAARLTLKIMGGSEVNLPRANIKGTRSFGQSLMPEGLEAGISVQDMADLLTFIEDLR